MTNIVPQVSIHESHWLTFRTVLPGKVFFYVRIQSGSQMYAPTLHSYPLLKIWSDPVLTN
jgi:hypothetical protein